MLTSHSTFTGMCARTGESMMAAMASWPQNPIPMAPAPWGFNDVWTYISAGTKNADGQQMGLIEVGAHAEGPKGQAGPTKYAAYWVDGEADWAEYNRLDPLHVAPGSDLADGRLHTYFIEARDGKGPWDIFYDYNFVASSANTGVALAKLNAGLRVRYMGLPNVKPFTIRPQWRDG